MYTLFIIKRIIEDIFIYPFVLFGRIKAALNKKIKEEYRIFFFFPFYHIGGAEKVHFSIAQATGGSDCIIFFTRKSANDLYYEEFKKSGCRLIDISRFTDNKWLYFNNLFFRGIISYYINSQKKKPVVFNGQCNFAYKLSPWLRKDIKQYELIHSFNTFSWIRIPFLPFINKSVMISRVRIEDHLKQYSKLKIPVSYKERIAYIINGIEIPSPAPYKNYFADTLKVVYVGRGTGEKRVHLIAEIAEKCSQQKLNAEFSFVGEVKGSVPEQFHPYCNFYGNISDKEKLSKIYNESHILIMTSTTEGFPMAVMEAMAYGLAILSTDVGDLKVHIENGKNGFLVNHNETEDSIVSESVKYIDLLFNNRELLQAIGRNNIEYANQNFGIKQFNIAYRKLLNENGEWTK